MNRRSFISLIGFAPIAGPTLSKEVISGQLTAAQIAEISAKKIGGFIKPADAITASKLRAGCVLVGKLPASYVVGFSNGDGI